MTTLPSGKVLVAGGNASGLVTPSAWLFDPTTGVWSPTGAMATARSHHAALLLRDGRVLVVGGGGTGIGAAAGLASAELYDPSSGVWSATGGLATSRYYFSATRLLDGRVLVTGGVHPEVISGSTVYTTVAGCELYDPTAGTWSAAAPLSTARSEHTATLLGNKVLVVGGRGAAARTAELFDVTFGSWSIAAPPGFDRWLHTATRLHDGRVLVAGGASTFGGIAQVERYDPDADSWTTTGSLVGGRFGHAASLLPSGEVVVTGGFSPAIATAERFDPSTGLWSIAGALGAARGYHQSTVMPDGRILVGPGWLGAGTYVANVDLLDLSVPVWSAGTPLLGSRRQAAAVLLPSGRVLVAGGLDEVGAVRDDAEVIDPGPYGGPSEPLVLPSPRESFTLTVLPSGQVLAVGGHDGTEPLSRVDLLDPTTGLWTPAPSLAVARAGHTATLLWDGSVLVVGGRDASGLAVAPAERIDPDLTGWSTAAATASPRIGHTATRLRSGEVLVAGGASAGSDELYDPLTNGWSVSSLQLGSGRAYHTATLLLDGRVLLAGGLDGDGQPLASAAIWGQAGVVGLTTSMPRERSHHRALLLPSGRVLVAGGANLPGTAAQGYEFDPATGGWRLLPSMACERLGLTLTLLPDGGALATGGADGVLETDRYSPGRQEDWPLHPSMANWSIRATPGIEMGVGVAGIDTASEAGSGTPGSSNLNHPIFIMLGTDGDGAAIAPRSRWDDSHTHFVVPSVGTGLTWLFPVIAGALGEGVPVFVDPPLGQPCTGSSQCAGGFCVDGVCCATACGGGLPDCQACSVVAGAPVDGSCAILPASIACRMAVGPCDVEDRCDGVGTGCGPDLRVAAGAECRAATDVCDITESCDGSAPTCPDDQVKAEGTVCRAAGGVCDLGEVCDGASASCPPDLSLPDGHGCDLDGSCEAGVCVEGPPVEEREPTGCGCGAGGAGAWALAPAAFALLPPRRRRRAAIPTSSRPPSPPRPPSPAAAR